MFPFLFANYFLEDFCAGLLFMITRLCRRIRILIGTANYISDMRTVPGDQDHRQRWTRNILFGILLFGITK